MLSATPFERQMHRIGARALETGTSDFGPNPVVLITDSFTGVFETTLPTDIAVLLQHLGHTVWVTSPSANGKALQVRGFRAAFGKRRDIAMRDLQALAAHEMPLIGLEPAVLDLIRRDYAKSGPVPDVSSLDQFLHQHLDRLPSLPDSPTGQSLFLHCTEKTADPATGRRWQAIFARFGIALDLPATGCCGMAGLFGHEAEHQQISRDLFDLSWRDPLTRAGKTALATGFSCRSQAKRFGPNLIPHPATALLARLSEVSGKDVL
ncbi:MAG: (Fe-S)-binding protein [Pelagimonas sp.]|jgi:Fe-S oxidoreductase|nr:(Fe-S)-binding protein [Pelagimonas sp.]